MKVVARSYFDAVGNSADEGLKCEDPSLAVQSAKDDCDINNIVKKYLRTGELPEMRQAVYADVSELGDLRDATERVLAAEEAFMQLPAEVRRYFDNDPVRLVEFSQDPANLEKAVELGLAVRREPSPPRQPDPAPAATGAKVEAPSVAPGNA